MKKLIAIMLAATMVLSMTACGAPAEQAPAAEAPAAAPAAEAPAAEAPAAPAAEAPSADPAVKLVYAEVNPDTSLMGQVATFFKQKVEELSGGSVTVDVQYSAVLGAEGDVLEAMTGGAGTIDVARISPGSLTSYEGVKLTSLISCPYILNGREHFWKFADSEIGQKILAEPSELGLGIHGMFYVEEGFRNFFFANEIKGLSDLAGKKIRVSTDAVMTGMVEGLGANPTVVAFNELYTSLSSGVVDGAEQPIANYQSNAFYEVAPYMILDNHTLGCGEVIILDSTWDKLTDNQKAALTEAGKAASAYCKEISEAAENACKEELEAKGVTFIPVENKQEWKDACAGIIAQVTAGIEDSYEAINALA